MIFVAPFYEKLELEGVYAAVAETFYRSFDWEKLKLKLKGKTSYSLYSNNDPYVPMEFAERFVAQTGSSPLFIKNGAHLGESLKTFPLLKELCLTRV